VKIGRVSKQSYHVGWVGAGGTVIRRVVSSTMLQIQRRSLLHVGSVRLTALRAVAMHHCNAPVSTDWLSWGFTSHSTKNRSFRRCSQSQSLGLVWKKQNLTQQKHTFTNQKNAQHKINTQKTKARFSRLLRHPAWKRRGPIPVSARHKSVTYLLS